MHNLTNHLDEEKGDTIKYKKYKDKKKWAFRRTPTLNFCDKSF